MPKKSNGRRQTGRNAPDPSAETDRARNAVSAASGRSAHHSTLASASGPKSLMKTSSLAAHRATIYQSRGALPAVPKTAQSRGKARRLAAAGARNQKIEERIAAA